MDPPLVTCSSRSSEVEIQGSRVTLDLLCLLPLLSAPVPQGKSISCPKQIAPLSLCARTSHICNSHDGRLHMFLESIAWRLHSSMWPVWVFRATDSSSLYPRRQVATVFFLVQNKSLKNYTCNNLVIAGNLCCRCSFADFRGWYSWSIILTSDSEGDVLEQQQVIFKSSYFL